MHDSLLQLLAEPVEHRQELEHVGSFRRDLPELLQTLADLIPNNSKVVKRVNFFFPTKTQQATLKLMEHQSLR